MDGSNRLEADLARGELSRAEDVERRGAAARESGVPFFATFHRFLTFGTDDVVRQVVLGGELLSFGEPCFGVLGQRDVVRDGS